MALPLQVLLLYSLQYMPLPDRFVIPGEVSHHGPVVEVDGEDEWAVHDVVHHRHRLHLSPHLHHHNPDLLVRYNL